MKGYTFVYQVYRETQVDGQAIVELCYVFKKGAVTRTLSQIELDAANAEYTDIITE